MTIKKIFQHKLFFPILLTAIYFLVNLVLLLHHEAWREEVNAWQSAKAFSIDNIYNVLSVEPHPLLYYLLLLPLAKLGLPFIASSLLSLSLSTLAVFIFLHFAPFSKKSKLLILFSAAFLYFLPVMGRNYSLVALAFSLLAALYKQRLAKPFLYSCALALLFQSHFLAAGFASVLTGFFIYDYLKFSPQKKRLHLFYFLSPVLISLLASLPMIIGTLTTHSSIIATQTHEAISRDWLVNLNYSLFASTFPIFEISMLLILPYLFLKHKRQFIQFSFALAFHLIVIVFIYDAGTYAIHKNVLIVFYLLFVFWVAPYDSIKKIAKPKKLLKKISHLEISKLLTKLPPLSPLLFFVIATIPFTLSSAIFDFGHEFSYTQRIAEYFNQNTPNHTIIFLADPEAATAAAALIPFLKDERRIYDLAKAEYIDFFKYDKYPKISVDQIMRLVDQSSSSSKYFISGLGDSCTGSALSPGEWPFIKSFEGNQKISEPTLKLFNITDTN